MSKPETESTGRKSLNITRDEWVELPIDLSDAELTIGGWQVMQAWERPLMNFLARVVTATSGDVLEIGFGMGLSARAISAFGCRSYTVIEAHPEVATSARQWGAKQPMPVTVITGFWESVIRSLDRRFDGILFDTYPLSETERGKNHYNFIPHAPDLLKNRGVLTYYSDETRQFRGEHLRLLLQYFSDVRLATVSGLEPFGHCDYWDHDHMVIPIARMLDPIRA